MLGKKINILKVNSLLLDKPAWTISVPEIFSQREIVGMKKERTFRSILIDEIGACKNKHRIDDTGFFFDDGGFDGTTC